MIRTELESTVATTANKLAIWSGLGTAVWGFVQQNLLGFVGVVVTVISMIVTNYYKRRDDARRAEYHAVRLESRRLQNAIYQRALLAAESAPPRPSDLPPFVDTATEPAQLREEDNDD